MGTDEAGKLKVVIVASERTAVQVAFQPPVQAAAGTHVEAGRALQAKLTGCRMGINAVGVGVPGEYKLGAKQRQHDENRANSDYGGRPVHNSLCGVLA